MVARELTAEVLSTLAWNAIPVALLPRLFDPFRRGAPSLQGSRSVGLGPYISRELVRVHGGAIEIASKEGAGTTITVTVPVGAPALA